MEENDEYDNPQEYLSLLVEKMMMREVWLVEEQHSIVALLAVACGCAVVDCWITIVEAS